MAGGSARLYIYASIFAAGQLIAIAATIAVVWAFDINLNTGVSVGGMLAAALAASTIFVKREGRAPTASEKRRLALWSLLASWLISSGAVCLLLLTIGTEADTAYFRQMRAMVPLWLMTAIVAVTSVALYALFSFCYGGYARRLAGLATKQG